MRIVGPLLPQAPLAPLCKPPPGGSSGSVTVTLGPLVALPSAAAFMTPASGLESQLCDSLALGLGHETWIVGSLLCRVGRSVAHGFVVENPLA